MTFAIVGGWGHPYEKEIPMLLVYSGMGMLIVQVSLRWWG